MAVVKELICVGDDQTLSFGDYTLDKKTKLEDFEFQGDLYKVKTFVEMTKLERNGMFVYESVPGTAVRGFKVEEEYVSLNVSGPNDAQFTLELEPDTYYNVRLNGADVGDMKTNLGGKLSISVELEGEEVEVKIIKL